MQGFGDTDADLRGHLAVTPVVYQWGMADTPLTITPTCDHCEQGPHAPNGVMLEMAPGPDGIPWYLCPKCWFEGLHPNSMRTLGIVEGSAKP